MHIQQFAQVNTSFAAQQQELQALHLIPSDYQSLSLADLSQAVFDKLFPETNSPTTLQATHNHYLVTASQNLGTFLQTSNWNLTRFNTVALQLLQFEVGTDFELDQTEQFIHKVGLDLLMTPLVTPQDFLQHVYTLLTVHTKFGITYLDDLTNRGYFKDTQDFAQPLFFNGKAVAVFDPQQAIHEVVYVESDLDTDHDGKRDLLAATIVRPRETENGLKLPVLYTASPYYRGTNDVDADLHNVNRPFTTAPATPIPTETAVPTPAPRTINGTSQQAELTHDEPNFYSLNEYLLPRGFINVFAGGIGTRDSDGIRTCGSPAETASTTAIIEWLHGDRVAFTNKTDGIAIKAWWCNGNIGMTGKSYLGTLALAAATTGVAGLKTVVAEAAISSWYDYYRDQGAVIAPVDCQGEDADVLAKLCFTRQKDAADYQQVQPVFDQALQQLTAGQDRNTGDYNAFWDARNYRKHLDQVKASVILVHGLNDWNVKLRNPATFWQGLHHTNVTHKLMLYQGKHIYMNNMPSIDFTDMINLWLTQELFDVANHATATLPQVLVQDNVQPETWLTPTDWSSLDNTQQHYGLATDQLVQLSQRHTGITQFQDDGGAHFLDTQQTVPDWEQQLLAQTGIVAQQSLAFKTSALTTELIIDGAAQLQLKLAVDQPHALLSAMLVDYGVARRLTADPTVIERQGYQLGYHWLRTDLVEFTQATPTPFKMITKGHLDLENTINSATITPIVPNQQFTAHLDFQPMRYRLPAGHQLGLIIYATDPGMTLRTCQQTQYQVDLAASQLTVPYQG
jgi:X-Pro dipeptidyl-peptidase